MYGSIVVGVVGSCGYFYYVGVGVVFVCVLCNGRW